MNEKKVPTYEVVGEKNAPTPDEVIEREGLGADADSSADNGGVPEHRIADERDNDPAKVVEEEKLAA